MYNNLKFSSDYSSKKFFDRIYNKYCFEMNRRRSSDLTNLYSSLPDKFLFLNYQMNILSNLNLGTGNKNFSNLYWKNNCSL